MTTSSTETIRSKGGFSAKRKGGARLDSVSSGVTAESEFLRLLRLERKRAERSGHRFVLMLLEVSSLVRYSKGRQLLDSVLSSLVACTRETDAKGWYQADSIFGVVFTDVESPSGIVLKALLSKVSDTLSKALTSDQVNELRLSFYVFPENHDDIESGSPNLLFYRDLVRDFKQNSCYLITKRIIDVLFSLLSLILLAPVFLAIALAIRLTSRGPILFRQQRVGHFYQKFTFLKFRSMYTNNDASIHKEYVEKLIGGDKLVDETSAGCRPVYKITRDPRVTPIGRFLRRTSLDELPQLINVLRGEMTLVGPRPCIPYELRCYDTWHRQRVLAVKPGITGLWQVVGRSRVQFDDMVRLDLEYADSRSIWLDLKILLQTPRAVLFGAGAY